MPLRPVAIAAALGAVACMTRHHLSIAMMCAIVALGGCRDRAADAAALAAAQAAAREQAANADASAFDAAVAQENWTLAKAQGEVLFAKYPDSAAAVRVRTQYAQVKAKAEAAREALRAAALWSYNIETVKGGRQLSASLYARDGIDSDGSGAKQVRLIFRDHPAWGRSSYLVLQAGDFACHGGCKVRVGIDAGAARAMAALRPRTDEAIAMFVNDERALWRMTRDAKLLSIEFPVKAGGVRTAVFEVAGLDRGKLPGWD